MSAASATDQADFIGLYLSAFDDFYIFSKIQAPGVQAQSRYTFP